MNISLAKIHISNLRLRTFIGFNPEEKAKQQDVVINIDLHYPASLSAQSDSVEDALNYKVVTKKVIQHVEEGRFLLLEKLVSDILAISCEHPWVRYCQVKVDKPHALRFADSVSLSLEAHLDSDNSVIPFK